jgi:hypothetical protein
MGALRDRLEPVFAQVARLERRGGVVGGRSLHAMLDIAASLSEWARVSWGSLRWC